MEGWTRRREEEKEKEEAVESTEGNAQRVPVLDLATSFCLLRSELSKLTLLLPPPPLLLLLHLLPGLLGN